jgi:hypothetical protein
MRDGMREGMREGMRRGFALRNALLLPGALLVASCGERRDVADLAVGVAPFEDLRGINAVALRSGGVRAFRAAALPAPFEGLRETIGTYDVVYEIPGFDGSNGSWPSEDALVTAIEATAEERSDAGARGRFDRAVAALQDGLGVGPRCYALAGPGFTMTVAQWDRGGGWVVTASLAPATVPASRDPAISARHSIAVRREAITVRYPQAGAPNPNELPTWTEASCSPE